MSENKIDNNPLRDTVVTMASIALLLAFSRYASQIVVPFLLATFIAIVASTPVKWLRTKGLPPGFAIALIFVGLFFIQLFIAVLLGSSIQEFDRALPNYQTQINTLLDQSSTFLSNNGITVSRASIKNALDPGAVMRFANNFLLAIAAVMSNAVLIIFLVLFMLMFFTTLPEKLEQMGEKSNGRILKELIHIAQSTNEYIAIKTVTSFCTGILIWLGLVVFGLDFAILLGFIAFILNFVPTIGSLLAAVPALILTLIQFGPSSALLVAAFYLMINTLMSFVVEPKVMGSCLGLSTLAVFMSLVFWGWLFGPIGMLLSVPLTMVVQSTALVNPQTRWFGILLGAPPEKQADFVVPD